jgi:serine O-acetyltransferase
MAPQNNIWRRIMEEAAEHARREPFLGSFLYSVVLNHSRLEDALSFHLASKLGSDVLPPTTLRDIIDEALEADPAIGASVRADLRAVEERDPACPGLSTPLLYFKGFHAMQCHRVAHYFWRQDRKELAFYLQSRIAQVFSVDVHPAARLGSGLLMDHATGVVIGETAVVEDNVSMLHEVTLGGTGKESGDRHPKIRQGVLIGAGAKLLGNIEVGQGAKVGAGSVVLEDVPPHCTAVGVPARIVCAEDGVPAQDMNHLIANAARLQHEEPGGE